MTRADCRCRCGKLVARATPEGLELLCRGCKRKLMVSFHAGSWCLSAGPGLPIEMIPADEPGRRPPRPAPEPVPTRTA